MKRLLLVALATLAGCATASPMLDASGSPMWAISCPGTASSLQTCFRKAEELCSAGYRLLETEQALGPVTGSAFASPSGGFGSVSQSVDRTVYVRCE